MFSRIRIGLVFSLFLIAYLACTLAGCQSISPDNETSADEPVDISSASASPTPLPTTTEPPSFEATATMPPDGAIQQTQVAGTAVVEEGATPTWTPTVMTLDKFAQELEKLNPGSALFQPPGEMRVGETEPVEVRVTLKIKDEIEGSPEVSATLVAEYDGEADVEAVIPLERVGYLGGATQIGASLTAEGESFEIKLVGAEEERLLYGDYVSWTWNVTPQKSGEHELKLILWVVVNPEGEQGIPYTITELDRSVQVRANLLFSIRQFFGTNWEWVATGLLFPAVGWAWRKLKGRRTA